MQTEKTCRIALCCAIAVACIVCANPPAAAFTIFGQSHEPLGSATLTVSTDATLIVSPIGSSGDDGVQVNRGITPSISTTFTLPAELTTGGMLNWSVTGRVDGIDDQIIASLHINGTTVGADAYWELTPNFTAIGSGMYRRQVYNGAALVADDPVGYLSAGLIRIDAPEVAPVLTFGKKYAYDPLVPISIDLNSLGGPSQVSLDYGTSLISATRMVFTPEFAFATFDQGKVVDFWRGTDLSQIELRDQTLTALVHDVHGRGLALVRIVGDQIIVENLGSDGDDGVLISGPPPSIGEGLLRMSVSTEPIDLADVGDGVTLRVLRLSDGGGVFSSMGEVDIERIDATAHTVQWDFSDMNADEVVVEPLVDGDPFGESFNWSEITFNMNKPAYFQYVDTEIGSLILTFGFSDMIEITPPGELPILANGFRITALGGDPVDSFYGLELLGRGLDQIVINSVTSIPAALPEPASGAVLALAVAALLRRRRV